MRAIKITTPDRNIYYLKPCAAIDHSIAAQMLEAVRGGDRELCQRLIDLFPRADCEGRGFPLQNIPPDLLSDIFLKEGCVIEELLRLPPQEKQAPSIRNPPLKESGNPMMDVFGRLSVSIGIEPAWLLINKLSFEELIAWQEAYNEASRPIEERRKEYIDKLWEQQIAESPESFYDQFVAPELQEGGI